jgi:hypothetical protein
MKILTLIVAAAALQAGAALAEETAPATPAANGLICRWEATQQSGIPVKLCLTKRQWMNRTLNTQQWIREVQIRSYVKK